MSSRTSRVTVFFFGTKIFFRFSGRFEIFSPFPALLDVSSWW